MVTKNFKIINNINFMSSEFKNEIKDNDNVY